MCPSHSSGLFRRKNKNLMTTVLQDASLIARTRISNLYLTTVILVAFDLTTLASDDLLSILCHYIYKITDITPSMEKKQLATC